MDKTETVFTKTALNANAEATGMPRLLWYVLSCTSFILIWNTYPKSVPKGVRIGLKTAGWLALLTLAVVYRGGTAEKFTRFEPHWWGILGLIGWAYLAAALMTVFAKNRIFGLIAAWCGFGVLSVVAHADLLPEAVYFIPGAIRNGTLAGLSMGGVVVATVF